MVARAEGMHYWTPEGRRILDGFSGLWCCNAGHNRKPIVEAIQKQAATMDYAPAFQMGQPLAFELANRIVEIAPEGMDHVFFCNSGLGGGGHRAQDRAGLPPHEGRGHTARASSAASAATTAWASAASRSAAWSPTARCSARCSRAWTTCRTRTTSRTTPSRAGEPGWGAHLADELERLVALHDASTIAAVIVEPMAGSTGVLFPPKGYLKRLREITRKHGILLIFDEVITGLRARWAAPSPPTSTASCPT